MSGILKRCGGLSASERDIYHIVNTQQSLEDHVCHAASNCQTLFGTAAKTSNRRCRLCGVAGSFVAAKAWLPLVPRRVTVGWWRDRALWRAGWDC